MKQQYSGANVYVSQIPPRQAEMKDSVKQLNYLIANGMKEGVHIILQNNLSEIRLHDEKHIKRNHVWIYEENMIKRIYEVSGNEYVPPKQTNQTDHSRRNSSPPSKSSSADSKTPVKSAPFVNQILGVLEQSNKQMLDNMKEMLKQCLIAR